MKSHHIWIYIKLICDLTLFFLKSFIEIEGERISLLLWPYSFFVEREIDTMFKRSRNRQKESLLLYNGEIKSFIEIERENSHFIMTILERWRERCHFFYQVITCDENLWIECFDGVDPFDLAFMVDVVSNPWMISHNYDPQIQEILLTIIVILFQELNQGNNSFCKKKKLYEHNIPSKNPFLLIPM